MIILIDNYDSFTFNLYQYLGELGKEVKVYRNDEITVEKISSKSPEAIVLSPGPGRPQDAGICIEVVNHFKGKVPLLGVCLGHQSIAEAFGAKIIHAPSIFHGKPSLIHHNQNGIFASLNNPLTVGRYHSLVIDKESLPNCFSIIAETEDKIIMAIQHNDLPITGIQFHPESILTEQGREIMKNFLTMPNA